MVSDETAGCMLMGFGGFLLIYIFAGVEAALKSYSGDTGVIVYYFAFIGFLAFLFIGYGLFDVVKAAMSSTHEPRREK